MKKHSFNGKAAASLVFLLLTAIASYLWGTGVIESSLPLSLLPVIFAAAFTLAEASRLREIERKEREAAKVETETAPLLGRSA